MVFRGCNCWGRMNVTSMLTKFMVIWKGRQSNFGSSEIWDTPFKYIYIRLSPLPVRVTTRIITFLVGNPYKPSFPLLLGGGTTQYIYIYISVLSCTVFKPPMYKENQRNFHRSSKAPPSRHHHRRLSLWGHGRKCWTINLPQPFRTMKLKSFEL